VEATLGISSLDSPVLQSVSKAQLFTSDRLVSYDFGFGYDPTPSGVIPYFTVGVAGVDEGGTTKFAGVIGLGKRIPLGASVGSDPLSFRYDLRDQIFSQKINNGDPFVSHNIVFSVGLQLFL
jgi:hypothetical protein